jgi:hydroxypyruvate reductase
MSPDPDPDRSDQEVERPGPAANADGPTIRDRGALARKPAHHLALACVEAGIAAARPDRAVARACELDGGTLSIDGDDYDLAAYDRLLVVGAGKASVAMVRGLHELLGGRIDGGLVVTDEPPDGAVGPGDGGDELPVEVLVGEHPTPGEGSREAGRRLLELAADAADRTLVLAPVSGGGSALLAAPAGELTLANLRDVTDVLLAAGADIDEINAVRKHCSAVKGGRLARAFAPATVVGLLVSDVVGDDPAVIASGPLSPDPSTYADAVGVLDRYGIDAPAVRRHLAAGAGGDNDETPNPGDPTFDRVRTHVVANGRTAIDAAAGVAADRGATPLVLSTGIEGQAREAGRFHAAVAAEALEAGDPVAPPAVLLSGGETTVTVEGEGDGGPNLECALGAALDLPAGAVVACVDTDGRDGGTDVAGAVVDSRTVEASDRARDALARNDALGYLRGRESVVETGATGTNVNDLRVLVVGA